MPPSKSVTLALASFMDSEFAKSLSAEEADVRKIVVCFLTVCYDDLGIEPKKLDGQDMQGALRHVLPGKFKRGEALAEEVPDVLRAYLQHLEEIEVLSNAFELKQGFETTIDEFLRIVKTGTNPHGHGHQAPIEPFEHKADKLGRNDPCSCGSGKKYKKCHGKNA